MSRDDWEISSSAHVSRENARTTVHIGDEVSDVLAFRAVHELGGIAIAVDEEGRVPQPGLEKLMDSADLVLAGPTEVHRSLATLCGPLTYLVRSE
jgi:predicted HAD superfamily phosphohydrolase